MTTWRALSTMVHKEPTYYRGCRIVKSTGYYKVLCDDLFPLTDSALTIKAAKKRIRRHYGLPDPK